MNAAVALLAMLALNAPKERPASPPRTSPHSPETPHLGARPEARSTSAPRAWPERLGPYRLVSKDGSSSVKLGFAAQLQLDLLARDVGAEGDPAPGDRAPEATPRLRRVRLLLGGSVLSRSLRYYLQISTAPSSLELMDYFLDYRFHPQARLRVGQFKIPFTNHRDGSFKTLTLVDWSILVAGFGAERQLGLQLHNDGSASSGLFYAVGLFTGQNARKSNNNLLARTWGETLGNPSDLASPAPFEGFHPEICARLAYKSGGIDTHHDTDFKGGGFRFAATLSLSWDLKPDVIRDQALRAGAELLVKARGASFFAAAYLGTGRGDRRFSQRLAMIGALVQASYLVRRRFEIALRYALIHFDQSLLDDARQRAGDIIDAETDPDARAALEQQYLTAGINRREHEASLGFNWYIIGSSWKLQTDLSWLGHERASAMVSDIRWRTLLQLAF